MKSKLLALGLAGWCSLVVLSPADAKACGGCFHGEPATATQSPSVVTDHRMVLALSPTMTTLWDQVEYAGDPDEFAWVLPIRGKVVVGLGNDSFISALDNSTAPVIRAPRRSCAPSGFVFDDSSSGGGCGASSSDMASAPSASPNDNGGLGWQEDSGVFVTDRSTVGPYETVQVHGADAGGIIGWLRSNKYVVPVELEPMLQKYVSEGFDFVAVKLRPGLGVHAMRPIRVSFKGAYPTLPLRMVAAGVGAKVGLKLFVIASGRWKTSNFPTLAIDPQMVTWDFTASRSAYTLVRDREARKLEGRAWALESSINLMRTQLPVSYEPAPPAPPADSGVTDTSTDTGSDTATDASEDSAADAPDDVAETASDAAVDTGTPPPEYDAGEAPGVDPYASDLEVAFGTLSSQRVTRLRADLPSKYLDVDLNLEADDNQSELPRELQVSKAVNENCPPAPSAASSSSSSDGCDCNVAETNARFRLPVGICAAAVALAFVRRRRR